MFLYSHLLFSKYIYIYKILFYYIHSGADSFAFSGIYGDVAEELYESTLALFKKWKLPEQWGTGVTTVSPTNSKGYEL